MTATHKTNDLETKSGADAQVGAAFEEFMRAFEGFKSTNDERLAQIEARMSADVVTTEKLERINRSLDTQRRVVDELKHRSNRPRLGSRSRQPAAASEHKAAFNSYVRNGETAHLRQLESKALSAGSDPDGGYLVPDETETTIMQSLRAISPIRAIAGIRQVSSATYKKPFSISGPSTGWVGETDARPETTAPTLSELTFPTMELYAMPAATASLLDDSAVNIDQWIAEEVRNAFAEQEGTAFVTGDGVNKPRGFLDFPKIANSSWNWGNIGYLATGTLGGFDATNPSDDLIDLIYSIKAGYRGAANWVMNRTTQAEIRKIKDSDGNYIWQPAVRPGEAPTLMNFPVTETEDMANIAADSFAIAFGDFGRGYLIVDRVGIRVLRDPYSSKPYVLFYTTKRVGGGVQDFDAIKLLKFGTS